MRSFMAFITLIVVSIAFAEAPQIGLNFIRFFWVENPESAAGGTEGRHALNFETPYYQPDWIFQDFQGLGVESYRQFVKADLMWGVVEPRDDEWDFRAADAVLMDSGDFEPIVTLFAMQYSSPTPPWSGDFRRTMGPQARDYVNMVVERYKDHVTYWELGNEMDHWRIADPGEEIPENARGNVQTPRIYPEGGYSPQEQGAFLAEAAEIIRQHDPDAVIVLPGMSGLGEYELRTWLAGVILGGGDEWFDVVNYHFYGPWFSYGRQRMNLQETMEELGIDDKPVWMTETGSSSSETLTLRTDYPNSSETQAADVFRRIVQAFGHGDSHVMWHTYIGSPDTPGNIWRLYGLRTDSAEPQPSMYSFRLLTEELIPFEVVEKVSGGGNRSNLYRITTEDGAVKYVAWGSSSGSIRVPEGVFRMTSVVPDSEGDFEWEDVTPGQQVTISAVPLLLK